MLACKLPAAASLRLQVDEARKVPPRSTSASCGAPGGPAVKRRNSTPCALVQAPGKVSRARRAPTVTYQPRLGIFVMSPSSRPFSLTHAGGRGAGSRRSACSRRSVLPGVVRKIRDSGHILGHIPGVFIISLGALIAFYARSHRCATRTSWTSTPCCAAYSTRCHTAASIEKMHIFV